MPRHRGASLRRLHWSLPAQRIRVGKINLSPLLAGFEVNEKIRIRVMQGCLVITAE
ncbi:type I addiction module toxin, SymE family [Pseudomonas aeruginosa]|nr:type I addiction module toxin, SymE family [Pseudomonas aeruginosa]MBK3763246.1 type I addiction module toxin, SymE family [Pseudomonas aeruginosa]MBK3769786.1 type I addiction module toxin, SymE family [Pseudomonas aeruginosa]MBK3789974.1 type I addiction module toxin, SymE family [Pseudomonas aeruginosa]MBK3886020.1 type I addiction module toxin, SymE family [Pseudomonas aeruginosa]